MPHALRDMAANNPDPGQERDLDILPALKGEDSYRA